MYNTYQPLPERYLIVGQVDLRQPLATENFLGKELKLVVLEVDNFQITHPLQGAVHTYGCMCHVSP